jgi:hypothetical protein
VNSPDCLDAQITSITSRQNPMFDASIGPGVLRGVETKKMALNKYLSKEKKLAFVEAI